MSTSSNIKRWAGWLVLVLVFSIACAGLSNWQFNRRAEALDKMNQVAKNYDEKPVPLGEVATFDNFNSKLEWRPVQVQGHYLPLNAVLVRNRPLDGNPGFLQVVPFQLLDGAIVAIERGWIATDSRNNAPKTVPLPSAENQTVIARVRPSEPTLGRSAPLGQLATINPNALARSQGIKDRIYSSVYLRMASEQATVVENPKQLSKPQLDEGNHLSYALQWILFAIMAVAALVWGIRKEREALSANRKPTRRGVGSADADYEDSVS